MLFDIDDVSDTKRQTKLFLIDKIMKSYKNNFQKTQNQIEKYWCLVPKIFPVNLFNFDERRVVMTIIHKITLNLQL